MKLVANEIVECKKGNERSGDEAREVEGPEEEEGGSRGEKQRRSSEVCSFLAQVRLWFGKAREEASPACLGLPIGKVR
jgi:hypothetical protein